MAATCGLNNKVIGNVINISSTPSGGPTGVTYTVIVLKNDGSGDVTLANQTSTGAAVNTSYTVISSDAGKVITIKSYSFYTCPADSTTKTSPTEQCIYNIPAATTGNISCDTTPSGASVKIDGILQTGVTPIIYGPIATGSHSIIFTLAGYNDCTQTVTVTSGGTVTASCTLTPVSAGSNLIPNPGFELGTTPPTGWNFNPTVNGTITVDTVSPHTGTRSVKIDVPGTTPLNSGDIYQWPMAIVKPNTQYILSGWGRQTLSASWNAGGIAAVEFDSSSNWIGNFGTISEFNSTTWIQKTVTFTTSLTTTQIMLSISIYSGYGTFWVDDVSLTEVITSCAAPSVSLVIS